MSGSSNENAFASLGRVAPDAVREARVQAHWAAQVVSASADARLDRRDDDSQSNLGWDARARALVTRDLGDGRRAWIRPSDLTVGLSGPDGAAGTGSELPVRGRTLEAALDWMRASLEAAFGRGDKPMLRDYDMPSHPVRDAGAAFDASDDALAEISAWFDGAAAIVGDVATSDPRASAPRCWPHHFDLATLITIDVGTDPEEARSIGVGLSPGDSGIPAPYFYVNPWPRPEVSAADDLPDLAAGAQWHVEGWVGALVHAERITAVAPEARDAFVRAAVRDAISVERGLLGDAGPDA